MTVTGPVPADRLGVTLPHEHLLLDLYRLFQPHRDFLMNDIELAIDELRPFAEAGGRTVVEVTPTDAGRDPAGLKRIAEASGLNVIMGTGRYREPSYEPSIWQRSTNDIAAEFIHEIEVGVGGVRAGIIGEIGIHGYTLSPAEERVHRASARAQMRTGVAITTHANAAPVGLLQLDVFAEEGVDLRRVVIGHCDTYPRVDYHEAILERGAYVQFDTVRGIWAHETRRQVSQLLHHIRNGHLERLLISQDIALDKFLTAYGGNGYAYLVTQFVDLLREAGLSQEQIDILLIENPRRVLAGHG